MKEKICSRKFLISAAAFLASLGTSIGGYATNNELVIIFGAICCALSGAIYAACEAYVDGKSAGSITVHTQLSSSDKKLTEQVLELNQPSKEDCKNVSSQS